MRKPPLTVIDFFSGAGGFSEGFRQQGYQIIKGLDNWEPAVKTHNLNHGLSDEIENVLDYVGTNSGDVDRIETLPDADVFIGSPSCVTFSHSNNSGKADKSEGIRLIEAYLRIIAVKKNKPGSNLKAWLMENVPNSGNYVKHEYTFTDLNLERWAESKSIDPRNVALTLNGVVLNASDYGAPQNRSRFICGEMVDNGEFPLPETLQFQSPTLGEVRSTMPPPNAESPEGVWPDPNYPSLALPAEKISDHFYDSGLYITEWEQARELKVMHPFMGRMSFPEDESKTSRTITATHSNSRRESIIFKSERNRNGHGEYRQPTIREAASLMGYPYTYQFCGSAGLKWSLIGNSVCPQLSSALARAILARLGRPAVTREKIDFSHQLELYHSVDNLNTFSPTEFNQRKLRKSGARFRRSIFKGQNMTVDLLNYNPVIKDDPGKSWYIYIFYGTGMGHLLDAVDRKIYADLESALPRQFNLFEDFLHDLQQVIDDNTNPAAWQAAYEQDSNLTNESNPLVVVKKIRGIVENYSSMQPGQTLSLEGMKKQEYSLAQVLTMFSLAHIVYNNKHLVSISVSENSLVYEL